MEKYKLIKMYPSHGKLGDEVKLLPDGIYYRRNDGFCFPKQFIENYPEFWEKVEEPKDFEVLSFVHDGSHGVPIGYTVYMKDGALDNQNQKLPESHYLNSKCWSINSVKRISDKEVFAIGDKLDGFDVTAKISYFKIENNQIRVGVREIGIISLNACNHKKPCIAISEDGVELFEGSEFYTISTKSWVNFGKNILTKERNQENERAHNFVWFSSEKSAIEYITKNKIRWTDEDMISFACYARGFASHHSTEYIYEGWLKSPYNKKE